jgi:DNA-binding GntR family transcriptional regulator
VPDIVVAYHCDPRHQLDNEDITPGMSAPRPRHTTPRLIDRTTATEAAAKALRAMILSGEIAAGAPLRQDEVARRLGVSRTPLREALQRLEAEGLVRLDVHKGAVVAKPSIAQVTEIFELQQLLESIAGRQATTLRTEADLAELQAMLTDHAMTDDPADWEQGNIAFHSRLYEIAQKPLVSEIIGRLRNRSALYVHMLAASPQGRKRANKEHLQMLAALADRDADRIEALIKLHLQTTLEWLKSVIDA